jgi:aspartate-semialdehyde dehydrogenase
MKVAIAGASGLVGRHLMDLLVAESKIDSIFSFVRSKGTGLLSKVQDRV